MANSSSCVADLAACNGNLTVCNATLLGLEAAYDACGCNVDPCAGDVASNYSLGLHIAAVFIILVASALGTALPLLSRSIKSGMVPFLIVLGKCMGIGVILACALVHMLQPANESLTSPCVPAAFNTDYTAYAYLFAMLAALSMQAFDYVILRVLTRRHRQHHQHQHQHGAAPASAPADEGDGDLDGSSEMLRPKPAKAAASGHVHVPVLPLEAGVHKAVAAYMLEFGVSVHSIFIGLAIGVVGDAELTALLVALVFHQFFEGVALGSRLADAHLHSPWHETILCVIFSVAAPLGIAIGIGVATSLDPNSTTFLLVQGCFDAICAGILLYIGFALLFHDFPEDMETFCSDKKHEMLMRLAMFTSLWVGAGLMAFIGRYL